MLMFPTYLYCDLDAALCDLVQLVTLARLGQSLFVLVFLIRRFHYFSNHLQYTS